VVGQHADDLFVEALEVWRGRHHGHVRRATPAPAGDRDLKWHVTGKQGRQVGSDGIDRVRVDKLLPERNMRVVGGVEPKSARRGDAARVQVFEH